MNKLAVVGVFVIIVAASAVGYYLSSDPTVLPEENTQSQNVVDGLELVGYEVSQNAFEYELSQGSSVSYVLQKRFLQQADQEVIGLSEEIEGRGWFDFESGNGFLIINLDFATLATDNAQRDANTAKTFNDTSIQFAADLDGLNIVEDEEFRINVPGVLRINGITRETSFHVVGTINSEILAAEGFAEILISDFEIDPPSLAGIYTAEDQVELRFNVTAERINE